MKQFLYPFVATALITITPYLLTFEKGQDSIRGLFAFSILVLLLIFAFIKEQTLNIRFLKKGLLIFVALLILGVAWIDLQNIFFELHRSTSFWGGIPFLTTIIALVILKPVKIFSASQISLFLFLFLVLHLSLYQWMPSQPLAEFPLIKALNRSVKVVERDSLPTSIKEDYLVIDTATISSRYIDSLKSNVVILVESWGIPLDQKQRKKAFQFFDSMNVIQGIHSRAYSRTRTAEREDLLWNWSKNGNKRDSVFIPQMMSEKAKTMFFFGGDSTVQNRNQYISNIGFEERFFFPSEKNDSLMLLIIDSTLAEKEDQQIFIAWTTRDTRFPISGTITEIQNDYYERLHRTLSNIAQLAKKYPQVRFIVQGDHEPILSPIAFQELFYKRWVPFVVLN